MENKTCIEVLSVTLVQSSLIVVGQLLEGMVETLKVFRTKETGHKFIMSGIGYGSTASYMIGRRIMSLKPHEDNLNYTMEEGEILIQFE